MRILRLANKGVTRQEFIRDVLSMLVEFSRCDISLRFRSDGTWSYWQAESEVKEEKITLPAEKDDFLYKLMKGDAPGGEENGITEAGSYWTNGPVTIDGLEEYGSVLIIPIHIYGRPAALLEIKNRKAGFFRQYEIKFYEGVCQTLGVAFSDRDAQAALRERVKELSCLYSISQLAQQTDVSLKEILMEVVDILPPAFQFPEYAASKIVFDDEEYVSPHYRNVTPSIKADIVAKGVQRGFVEVNYVQNGKNTEDEILDEEPFLAEEYNLINGVAKQLSLIVERKIGEEEQAMLQQQLQHADRLATIGELSAGVAHELNEPLGSILGFSQLTQKDAQLPEQVRGDIEKIERAALHAREIVKKLLIFARQMPTRKSRLNLNKIVQEGLYFLESRCVKEGITLRTELKAEIPEIIGDAAQLNQVLVNLVVNSIQAMDSGGTLTVITDIRDAMVTLTVRDTGRGMSEKVKNQIFLPFFTTKEVGQGTGLGLAVVHGIVTSHGGTIQVNSRKGEGAEFTVSFPVQ